MKKGLLVIFAVIVCAAAVIAGRLHWKGEVARMSKAAKAEWRADQETAGKAGNDGEQANGALASDAPADPAALTKHLPKKLQDKIKMALENKSSVRVLLAGGESVLGLAAPLQKQLNDAYGSPIFYVKEKTFSGENSLTVYQKELYQSLADEKPDVIIFTAMLIEDNGKVSTHDSARIPVLIGNNLKDTLPDATFMIEPPNPVTFYDGINARADELKETAKDAGYVYLDHLSAWPKGEGLANDLDKAGRLPNEKGIKLWADYLTAYFSGKKL